MIEIPQKNTVALTGHIAFHRHYKAFYNRQGHLDRQPGALRLFFIHMTAYLECNVRFGLLVGYAVLFALAADFLSALGEGYFSHLFSGFSLKLIFAYTNWLAALFMAINALHAKGTI